MPVFLPIDVYGAAALRIALGCVILLDLADRHFLNHGATDLVSFDALRAWGFVNGAWFTVHTSGAVYALHAVCAVALVLGAWSRIMSAVLFVLALSLQARNVTVGYGADVLLLQLLLIACFLPLGAVWSVDSRRRGTPPSSLFASPVASLALVLQLGMMYGFSVCHKLVYADDWWIDGTAIAASLKLAYFASPSVASALLSQAPWLLAYATRATLLWEGAGWLLLLLPHEVPRSVWLVTNLYFHLCLGTVLDIGLFSHVCIAATLAFAPWQLLVAAPIVEPATRSRSMSVSSALAQGLLASVMVLSFLVNVREVPFLSRTFEPAVSLLKSEPRFELLADALQLKQQWSMFAPVPRQNVQHVVVGTALGMRVELLPLSGHLRRDPGRLTEFEFTRERMRERLGGHRWLKLFEHMHVEHGRRFELIEAFLNHTCRLFPQADLLTFELAKQSTEADNALTQQRLFRNHACNHQRVPMD